MRAKDMNPEDEFYPFYVADHFYAQFPDYGWEDDDWSDKDENEMEDWAERRRQKIAKANEY